MGAVEGVAQEMMSARDAASSGDATAAASMPVARRSAASRSALAPSRFHTATSRIGRTAAKAEAASAAIFPAPTISSLAASSRARNDAASAETAMVRRAVISLPSSKASGAPVAVSASR